MRAVVVGRTTSRNGKDRPVEDRRSLGHSNRDRAVQDAKDLCRELAEARLTGIRPDALTLAQLFRAYIRECGGQLTRERKREVERAFGLLRRHVGDDFGVMDLGPHQVKTYIAARQAGTLAVQSKGNGGGKVRAGTIAKELGALHVALNWATTFKKNGRALLSRNPIHRVPLPSEPTPARPLASRERFEKLLEHADSVDRSGVFRTMLHTTWITGRRLGSIVALRASDVLLTPDQVRRALAAAGKDDFLDEEWPAGLRWVAEADKEDVEWIVPMPNALATMLGDYVKRRALVGNALLFPSRRDPSKPLSKETAFYWLRRAEKLAGLPHVYRGGWHALRRSWATARKHMPLQDVMAADGWRDPAALQRAYQHADAATVRAVMDVGS